MSRRECDGLNEVRVDHEALRGEMMARFAEITPTLEEVKAGVANFRKFQLTNARHVGQLRALAAFWSIVLGIVFVVFGCALNQLVPAANLILKEYYLQHPESKQQTVDRHTTQASTDQLNATE